MGAPKTIFNTVRGDGEDPPAGHPVALLAVLLFACLLLVTPAVVAAIAMIDAHALDSAYSWLQQFTPITTFLGAAKFLLAAGSVIVGLASRLQGRWI